MKRLLLAASFVALSGCASMPPAPQPHVQINNTTIQAVQNEMIPAFVARGAHINKQSSNMLDFTIPSNSFALVALAGATSQTTHFIFEFTQNQGAVDVYGDIQIVAKQNFGNSMTVTDANDYGAMQEMLNKLKAKMN